MPYFVTPYYRLFIQLILICWRAVITSAKYILYYRYPYRVLLISALYQCYSYWYLYESGYGFAYIDCRCGYKVGASLANHRFLGSVQLPISFTIASSRRKSCERISEAGTERNLPYMFIFFHYVILLLFF